MIEKFKKWLKEVETAAIEDKKKKAREANDGDDTDWKKQIWHSPDKNKAIKLKFALEGEKLEYRPRPFKKNNAGEWLYDFVWRKFDESKNLLSVDLTMEIEMSDMNAQKIRYDFNKLLQADSKYKILVFQLKMVEDVQEAFSVFKNAANAYHAKSSSKYLLCGWATSKNSFYFDDFNIEI